MSDRRPRNLPLAEESNAAAVVPGTAAAVPMLGLTRDELRAWFEARGERAYRADQVLEWVHGRHAGDFAQMTNVAKALRSDLAGAMTILAATVTRASSATDGTRKLLLAWPDGATVETVWIPEAQRDTACISSQSGCPVGCRFCASGIDGLGRNLSAAEIVEQAVRVRRLVRAATPVGEGERRLSNIVFMGMGEPLANYSAVVQALRIINAPWGLDIGARRITVSTVGLPRQIRKLADEGLQINLALSLHAPTDELRQRLIPWGRVPIRELLAACTYFFERTGREVTLEYVLLEGVNTLPSHADELARVARRLRCNINLLRYNPVPGLPFVRPTAESAYAFQARLRQAGINAHVRTSRGADVDAACGQLRRSARQATETEQNHVEPPPA